MPTIGVAWRGDRWDCWDRWDCCMPRSEGWFDLTSAMASCYLAACSSRVRSAPRKSRIASMLFDHCLDKAIATLFEASNQVRFHCSCCPSATMRWALLSLKLLFSVAVVPLRSGCCFDSVVARFCWSTGLLRVCPALRKRFQMISASRDLETFYDFLDYVQILVSFSHISEGPCILVSTGCLFGAAHDWDRLIDWDLTGLGGFVSTRLSSMSLTVHLQLVGSQQSQCTCRCVPRPF